MPMKTPVKVYRIIIEKFGMDLVLRPKVKVLIDSETTEDAWGDDRVFRGQITQITGYTDLFLLTGITVDADYLLNVVPEEDIKIGDLVIIDKGTPDEEITEVTNIVKRRSGGTVDVKELLLKRRG